MACRRLTVVLLTVLALIPVTVPAAGAVDPLWAEDELVRLINAERTSRGLNALAVHGDLTSAARAQSRRMRAEGRLYHTPDLGSVTAGWTSIAENVGYSWGVASVHAAFMNSQGHRDNILRSSTTHVGLGVVVDGGTIWVTEIFMAHPYTPPFIDDDGSAHESDIAAIAAAGITSGCDRALFCPEDAVSREQMAAFLSRALELGRARIDYFWDDNTSALEGSINAVAEAGITSGCAEGRFCPDSLLSRGEMATFLVRSLGLPATGTDFFSDDEGSPHEPAINALAAAGITNGCASGRFCPDGPLTRGEMATFLTRAFGF